MGTCPANQEHLQKPRSAPRHALNGSISQSLLRSADTSKQSTDRQRADDYAHLACKATEPFRFRWLYVWFWGEFTMVPI